MQSGARWRTTVLALLHSWGRVVAVPAVQHCCARRLRPREPPHHHVASLAQPVHPVLWEWVWE
jgi:hypothetical protein